MTAQTSRYKLTYPTGSDLVSGAPAQFKSMADSVEKALGEVDDRQTANAVKPVVRTTLAQLAEAAGVTGQTGYVTADSTSANNGAYVYNGSAWVKYAMKSDVDALADQITQGYESGRTEGTTSDLGALTVSFSRDHGTAPKSVMVVMARLTRAENRGSEYYPTVWEATSKNFQVRFANNGGGWSGRNGYAFYWLAIW